MGQLVFEWPARTSYAAEDFIPSPANQEALEFLATWPQAGDAPIALLCGGKGYGKTHLATSWHNRTNASLIDASTLGNVSSGYWWQNNNAALLEDIEKIADEKSLFHLLRHAESHNHVLLLTSALPARALPFTLPDLCSRLRALHHATLLPPDDALLQLFCLKLCADYQVRVSDEVIAYLIKRTERNFSSLHSTLNTLMKASLSNKRDITIPWLRTLLTIT